MWHSQKKLTILVVEILLVATVLRSKCYRVLVQASFFSKKDLIRLSAQDEQRSLAGLNITSSKIKERLVRNIHRF